MAPTKLTVPKLPLPAKVASKTKAKAATSSLSKSPFSSAAAAASASSPNKPKKGGGNSSTKDSIFRYVCEQHVMGVTESDKSEIALAVGYKNPRSENFSKAFRELVDDGTFRKAGGGKDKVSLTARGESMIPKDLEVSNDPSKIHQRYIEFVEKKVKVGSDKVRRVWNILQDRKEHPIADLATALGYSNPRSFGNTKIIAVMREAGLVEGKGGVMFTSKVPV